MYGCGGGDYDSDESDWSFFAPEIIKQPSVEPLFVSYHSYYKWPQEDGTQETQNAEEWKAYLNRNELTLDDIRNFIYNVKERDFDTLYQYINNTGNSPQIKWSRDIAEKIKPIKNIKNILNYLKFSKDIEKLMYSGDYWYYETKKDTSIYGSSIATGISSIQKCNDIFLKTRYAFQVERIYFYFSKYEQCAEWYQKNIVPLKPEGSIKYRSLGYYAGALYHQKKYDESNYLFSLLYDQYPEVKISAFESFHPWEDSDWNNTLNMAKNDREKAVLWQMFGVYADPLKGMKEIYKLNPKSELIDLLLVRSINIAEMKLLPNISYQSEMDINSNNNAIDLRKIFDSSQSFSAFDKDSTFSDLLSFIESTANNNNTNNQCLWYNTASYMNLVLKHYAQCELYLNKVKGFPDINAENKAQANITEALLKVLKIESIDKNTEDLLYSYLSKLNTNGASRSPYSYLMNHLSSVYEKQGDRIKSELCLNNNKFDFYSNDGGIETMLSFMRKNDLNDFEKLLLTHYWLTEGKIVEYQAVNYMYDGKFKDAIKKFEENISSVSETLYGNPFTIHISDCHDCDHNAPQKVKYTKYTFSKKMLELLQKAETSTDPSEKSQNYFLYANGLYNMTYYGNARFVHGTFNSINSMEREYYEDDTKEYDKRFYNCGHAKKYYQKAMHYAQNKEFKAKCAWMCAKCEINEFYENTSNEYTSPHPNYWYTWEGYSGGEYYKLLKAKYFNTKYYKEILNECGYFCTYNGGGEKCIRNR